MCLLGCFAPFVVRDSISGVSVALVIVSWCFGEGSLLRQVKGKRKSLNSPKKDVSNPKKVLIFRGKS